MKPKLIGSINMAIAGLNLSIQFQVDIVVVKFTKDEPTKSDDQSENQISKQMLKSVVQCFDLFCTSKCTISNATWQHFFSDKFVWNPIEKKMYGSV